MRPHSQLRDYQRQADEFVRTRKRGMLWMDVGLGKTASIATALEAGYKATRNIRTLVLATRAIAQTVWTEELREWEHLSWIAPLARTLVGKSAAERARLLLDQPYSRLDTMNYELLPWLFDCLRDNCISPGQLYDCIICDEVTRLKNPSGKWFKIVAKLAHPEHVPYFWGLTGTPTAEGYQQLWAPMYLVDYGRRLGYTESQYLEKFFVPVGDRQYLRQGADEKIQAAISDVVLTFQAEDYGVLPPVMYAQRRMPLVGEKRYRQLEREMMLQLQRGDVVAANAGVLIGKCLQYTSGAMYLVDELGAPTKQWEELHKSKLESLASLHEEMNGRPLLVAVQYRHEIDRIRALFPGAVHMHSGNVADVLPRWSAGNIDILVAHPLSCGHGLNLQHGGGDLCFFSLPYSLEQFEQTIGRLARPGQKRPTVMVHALVMEGSVDEDAWRALQSKQDLQLLLKRAMAARVPPSAAR